MDSTPLNFPSLFFASAQSSSQVLFVCAIGYLAAKIGIITKDVQAGLSDLIVKILMPCLLFSNIASSIDVETLARLWPIPAFFFTFATISAGFGWFGGKLLNLSDTNFVMAGIIFNNITSLMLGLLKGLRGTPAVTILAWEDNDSPDDIIKRGISYVLLVTLWTNLLRWTLGVYLLRKDSSKDNLPIIPHTYVTPNSSIHFEPVTYHHPTETTRLIGNQSIKSKIMNPPLYAALFALFIGVIPKLKSIFFGNGALLASLSQTTDYIGSIAVPLTLITLGAQLKNLSRTKDEKLIPSIAYIMTCRFLIMPIIGIVMVLVSRTYFIDDPMFLFVLMLLAGGPTAVNCMNMTQLTGNFQEEMAALLFYSYIAVPPLITIYIMGILSILGNI